MSVYELANLTKRDLLLEQQLQGISKRSVPSKELEGTPPTNLINSVQGDINLKDMAIEEQLQKISRNAIKDVLGWKPTQIKSDVTNEMIQDYQDEMANSFYDDPITKKRLKYIPVSSDMTLEVYAPQGILTDAQIDDFRRSIRELTTARRAAELEIVEKLKMLEEVKNQVEFNSSAQEQGYIRFVQRTENEINGYKARIFEFDGRIGLLQEALSQNEVAKRDNQAQKDKVSKANYQLLQQKSEELNLLNRGKLNLTRQPNETDDDFRQRVIDVGQVEFDETAIGQQAGRRAVIKFKENMKDITRNNILIENIIKSVEPSHLFLYNKFFEAIKSKFKEVYGKSTFKEGDYPELINIFDNIIDKVNLSTAKTQIATSDEPPPYATVLGQPLAPINLPNVPTQEEREKPQFITPEEEYARLIKANEAIGESYEYPPDPTPVAEARLADPTLAQAVAPINIRKNPYDLTKAELIEKFGKEYFDRSGNKLKQSASKLEIQQSLVETGIIKTRDSYTGTKPIGTYFEGKGLYAKLPKLAQFGKIMINPYALYYQNTLIITTNGTNHLTGYRNVKVSDDFVSIIMKIMNGENPNHKELQKLDLSEKELYDNVIHLAHLHKKVDHNLAQTRQAMKHRFELLNGEIGAGNNNKMLKKELADLVHKMAYAGMISHHQRNKFVKSL